MDAPFTSLGKDPAKPDQRRRDLKNTFRKITNAALEREADLLLISGDLYEHDYVNKSTLNFVSGELEKLQSTKTVILPGNHDPWVLDGFYMSFSWPGNVHILREGECYDGLFDKGVMVYGGLPENPPDKSLINIVMLHGTVDMKVGCDVYNPVTSKELCALGADYIALGHFHNMFRLPGGRVFNPGSPEPLGFDEEGDHGVFYAGIKKDGPAGSHIDVEFLKLCSRRYHNICLDITGLDTEEKTAEEALGLPECVNNTEDLFRIFLTGYRDKNLRINTDFIESYLSGRVFYAKITDRSAPDYNFEEIAVEPGLRGIFASKMLKKAEETANEQEKAIVMKALYYGMEAIDRGEVSL